MRRLVCLVVVAMALSVLSGCSVHPAVIQSLSAEQSFLAEGKAEMQAMYDARLAELEANKATVKAAMFKDIEAKKPLDAAWVISTIKGVDVAMKMVDEESDKVKAAKAQSAANFEARVDLLERTKDIVVKSQWWNSDTEALVNALLAKAVTK